MSSNIDIDAADKALSRLTTLVLIGYLGIVAAVVLAIFLANPDGESTLLGIIPAILYLIAVVALLICPIFIGLTANRLGKSGIVWGGLSFIASPFGQLIGYFMLKSAFNSAIYSASSDSIYRTGAK